MNEREREREREGERVLAPDERTETEQEQRDRREIAFRINRVMDRNNKRRKIKFCECVRRGMRT